MIDEKTFFVQFSKKLQQSEIRRLSYLVAFILTIFAVIVGYIFLHPIWWIVISFIPLIPVFMYRGRNRLAGIVPLLFSMKDMLYSVLLKEFGNFEFAPDAGLLMADLKNSVSIPEWDIYLAEDYIQGVMHNLTVKIAETRFVSIRNRQRYSSFQGLLAVIDIDETRVRLHGTLRNRTILLPRTVASHLGAEADFKGIPCYSHPDPEINKHFVVYTTDAMEGLRIFSHPVIMALTRLYKELPSMRKQMMHWDSKLAHVFYRLLEGIKDYRIDAKLKRQGIMPLQAENEYDSRYGHKEDFLKIPKLSEDFALLHPAVQMECFDDKVIMLLPCPHDFFEIGSLFEPALNSEDAKFLYRLMSTLDTITRHIERYLSQRPV